jgi:anti-anti-sigma regulatory factor
VEEVEGAMLSLHTDRINDVAIVECYGRIVRSDGAFALRDVVMSQRDARVIMLDLSGTYAIEGGGLGMLMFLQHWAYDHDIGLKLFNPNKSVSDRLKMANPIPDFEIVTPGEMLALLGDAQMRSAA